MTSFPFLPGEDRYLVIDDTDECFAQILYVTFDGLRLIEAGSRERDEHE